MAFQLWGGVLTTPTDVILDQIRLNVIGDQVVLKMTTSTTIQAIPQVVLDAALALHQRRNTSLTYSPSSTSELTTFEGNPFWHCVEDEIEFANLEARNRCVALATFQHDPGRSG